VSEIADFLRARLDEDERTAKRAASYDDGAAHDVQGPDGTWLCLDESEWFGASYRGGVIAPRIGYANAPELGLHITRHDPARVLAEVAAKRRIVDLYEIASASPELDRDAWLVMKEAVALLAQPFAAHPDHKGEEWAP
jgi:hypothetical protein